jgi:hypothetical protein
LPSLKLLIACPCHFTDERAAAAKVLFDKIGGEQHGGWNGFKGQQSLAANPQIAGSPL